MSDTIRDGDRGLWEDETGGVQKASPRENERVRTLLEGELTRWVNQEEARVGEHQSREDMFGHARKQLARDWVELSKRLGLKVPGVPARAPLAPGESAVEKQVDAAHTRIRQFQAGRNEQDWVLVGIESVVCDRRGLALPSKAYQTQRALPI